MPSSPGKESQATILFVEDHPDTRILLSEQLKVLQYNVVPMGHGAAALAWLDTHLPDVVILDWMLPDIDGIEICRRIRIRYDMTELPILMLSALGGDPDNRILGLQAGANDFMEKPFLIAELQARLHALLALQKARRQATDMLSLYVSKELHSHAMKDGAEEKQRAERHAVILFGDLRGFTHLSSTAPERLIQVLDSFFDDMMAVIHDAGGVVLDTNGDEILAAFNIPNEVPNASLLAVNAALQMQAHFKALQAQWEAEGIAVGLGVGIHQGQVMIGNFGGSQLKRFTVIGHNVNYAHRLVENARTGEIVLSAEVYDSVKEMALLPAHAHENIMLKGIDTMQTIFRISQ